MISFERLGEVMVGDVFWVMAWNGTKERSLGIRWRQIFLI